MLLNCELRRNSVRNGRVGRYVALAIHIEANRLARKISQGRPPYRRHRNDDSCESSDDNEYAAYLQIQNHVVSGLPSNGNNLNRGNKKSCLSDGRYATWAAAQSEFPQPDTLSTSRPRRKVVALIEDAASHTGREITLR
jgi:hypothetical protein